MNVMNWLGISGRFLNDNLLSCGRALLKMKNEHVRYRSYLLRLWPVEKDGAWNWRASLEEVDSGQRWVFTNLEILFNHLQVEMDAGPNHKKEHDK